MNIGKKGEDQEWIHTCSTDTEVLLLSLHHTDYKIIIAHNIYYTALSYIDPWLLFGYNFVQLVSADVDKDNKENPLLLSLRYNSSKWQHCNRLLLSLC